MRELVTWLAAVAAVCAHAVESPLGTNPENYVFAPFDDSAESSDRGGTNGVNALLQGYVMGPNASYRVIRAEDVAYMAEAIAVRTFTPLPVTVPVLPVVVVPEFPLEPLLSELPSMVT